MKNRINTDNIKESLFSVIHKAICVGILPYNEDMPEDFKKEFPDLFLSQDAPEKLKQLIYNRCLRGENLLDKMKDKKAIKRRQLMYLEIQRECDRYEDECIYLGWHYETTEERNQRLKEKEMKEKEKLHWQLHI